MLRIHSPGPAGVVATPRGATGGPSEVVFDYRGLLTLVTSDRYYPGAAVTAYQIQSSLNTTGTTGTTIALLRNGVSVATWSIAAGQNHVVTTISVVMAVSDWIAIQITSAGAAAAGLVCQVRLAYQ